VKLVTFFEGEQLELNDLRARFHAVDVSPSSDDAISGLINALSDFAVHPDNEHEADEFEPQSVGRRIAERRQNGSIVIGNLVGSVTLISGLGDSVQIEILPKVSDCGNSTDAGGAALKRMWLFAHDLRDHRDGRQADVDKEASLTLHEWLLSRFVADLRRLVSRGLRGAYVETEDNLSTLRGRLMVAGNIRRNAFAAHKLLCRFDEFSVNRPENRLIRAALECVIAFTEVEDTRKHALGLRAVLHEIPISSNIRADFAAWRSDRSMLHYGEIRQTCDWLLNRALATPISGKHRIFGRLVRMNDVFERYVGRWLAAKSAPGVRVDISKSEGEWLVNGETIRHQLVPDIRVTNSKDAIVAVLDTKWKKLVADNKPVSREDLFQLFAYGTHFFCTDDRVLAGVYPTINQNETVLKFKFRKLADVLCFRLPFLLPTRHGDRWVEGFIVDGDARDALTRVGLKAAIAAAPGDT